MTDYAYKKVKLSEKQLHFAMWIDKNHNGASDHIGVDYGGWTAHNQIVSALKKKGVMVSEKGSRYTLVVGEPLVIGDPQLSKPFIKIRKEILNATVDGDTFENINAQIYLDTRKDCTFHIIFPYNIKPLVNIKNDKIIARVHDINGEEYLVAEGSSVEECINNFKNLTTEYKLRKDGDLKDVILISYESREAESVPGNLHMKTMFGFNYFRGIQASDGSTYYVGKDGYMTMYEKYYQKENIIIEWTEQREAALIELRQRIIDAGNKLREVMFSQEFTMMLDAGGQLLLEAK